MMICGFDIETIPNFNLPSECIPKFDPNTVKAGNIKDADKINAKIDGAEQEFKKGLIKKMSVDPDLCQIVTFVGYIYDTDTIKNQISDKQLLQIDDKCEEWEVVNKAWQFIHQASYAKIPLVSFAGLSFDLPVLLKAAMRADVPVDQAMYSKLIFQYENICHYDLMRILTGERRPVPGKSLDFYAQLYGIGGKTGKGNQVYEWYQNKEYNKILEYCKNDVLVTCKLFERVCPWVKTIRTELEEKEI